MFSRVGKAPALGTADVFFARSPKAPPAFLCEWRPGDAPKAPETQLSLTLEAPSRI